MSSSIMRSSSGALAGCTGRAAPHVGILSRLGRRARTPTCLAVSSGGAPVLTTVVPVTDRVTVITPVATIPPVIIDYRVSLLEAMRFNGPAPELINGRLAMLGFLLGASGEAHTGETLLAQASHLSLGGAALIALWTYASLVPILAGAKNEAFGYFSPRAEMINGRAAMLGFATLMALEAHVGVPFF